MRVGYARVSQGAEDAASNLDTQTAALERAGVDRVVKEIISGAADDRPALDELLAELQAGDALVVQSIDRIARSVRVGLRVVDGLDKGGIGLVSLQDGLDSATPTGRLMLTLLLAVAEWEWQSIREKSIAGQQRAYAQGKQRGRPRKAYPRAIVGGLKSLIAEGYSMQAAGREYGLSWHQVRDALREG